MAAKNLYTILQIPPTATMQEIKKAYRKLALQYHPDKNPNNELASNYFLEIKKAYEILGNTAKRQQYTFDSWQQKKNQRTDHEAITPQMILKRTQDLAYHASSIDVFRMSQEALYLLVKEILSEENALVLKHAEDSLINKHIIEMILKAIKPLTYYFIKKLEPTLVKIACADYETIGMVHNYVKEKKKKAFWEKYNLLIIAIVTLLICLVIFFAGK